MLLALDAPAPVPILMYHRIAVRPKGTTVPAHYVAPGLFRRQLSALAMLGYEAVSLAQMHAGILGEGQLPRRPVVLTFDDGYQNYNTNAAPELERAGWKGTVFVVSGLAGSTNDWDNRHGDVVEPLMDYDTIRSLAQRGHEIGSHTRTHVRLAHVPPEAAKEEICTAKETLESELGRNVPYFCYPYGDHNSDVRQLVREAGHTGATTVRRGKNTSETDPFQWNRINVRSNSRVWVLVWKLLLRPDPRPR